ncbi:MAG: hypothetical protein WCN95_16310, partial [bacterium]
VIVKGENGLKGVEIKVDPNGAGECRSQSGWFGPAVSTDMVEYRLHDMRIEPVNPPLGATPGVTTFSLLPTYKSGFLLKLGQELKTIAVGRLVDERHEPLAHVSLEIRRLDTANAKVVTTFSGRSGNFQVENLMPGRYEIKPLPPTLLSSGIIEVSESSVELYRLGDVVLLPR